MVIRKRQNPLADIPVPIEHNGVAIIARLLLDADDIEKITATKISLSIKKEAFAEYQKGCYIDLLFLGDDDLTVYRYKMVSESETAINLRLECEVK